MRYINDVTIVQGVLHVLDVQGDEPILSGALIELDDMTLEFIGNHIIKSLNDDEGRYAEYLSNTLFTMLADEEMDFQSKSVGVAQKLFDVLKKNQFCVSGDLLFVEFKSGQLHGYAMMKLDYQSAFVHEIQFDDGVFNVHLSAQQTGLPGSKQRLSKCAFVDIAGDQIFVLNKKNRNEEPINPEYFLEEFLQCQVIDDETVKTKVLRNTVEKWARNHLKDDLETAMELRDKMNEYYKESDEVQVDEIIETVNDFEMRQDLANRIKNQGIDPEPIKLDKQWVEKNMKSKSIKTDTGFTIRGEFLEFKDDKKFEIIRNGDGTVNYLIKNVRNVFEK